MTAKPACARLCATPAPITPAPTTPIVRISIAPPPGCTHAPVRPGLYLGCGKDAEKRQPDRSLALLWQLPMTDPESPPPAVLAPFGHPIVRALLFVVAATAFEFGLGALFEGTLGPALEDLLATGGDQLLLFRALELPFEIAFALLFVRWLDRRAPATIGLAWPRRGSPLRQALLVPLATLGFLALWLVAIEARADLAIRGLSSQMAPGGFEGRDLLALGLLFLAFLGQGGIEELLVRGVLYSQLRESFRPVAAAVATSLLFALLHAGNPGFTPAAALNTFLAGCLLAALRERTGSLWAPTLVHGTWNFAVGALLSVPISGLEISHLLDVRLRGSEGITGGAYGPEASWVLAPLLALAVALVAPSRRPPGSEAGVEWTEEVRTSS